MKYIIVFEMNDGVPCFWQMHAVISWYFGNNHCRVFYRKETAIKNAEKKLPVVPNATKVHVIGIDSEDAHITCVSIQRYFGGNKDVFSKSK